MADQSSGVGVSRPRVFISYAHEPDSGAHCNLVRQLWQFLRAHGIDARVDLDAAGQRQDWSLWMADQIRDADHILIVASPAYRARAQGHSGPQIGRGVQWEARLIRDALYRDQNALNRFVPVILPGQTVEGVPDFLAPATTTVYHVREFTVAAADALLRLLTGRPSEVRPFLGPCPALPSNPANSTPHRQQALLQVGLGAALAWGLATAEWLVATLSVHQADRWLLTWVLLLVIAAPTAAAAWPRRLSARAAIAGVVIAIPFAMFIEQFWHAPPVIAAIGCAASVTCTMVDALGTYTNLALAAAAAVVIGTACAAAAVAVIIAAPQPALPDMLAGGVLIGFACGSTIGFGIAVHRAVAARTSPAAISPRA